MAQIGSKIPQDCVPFIEDAQQEAKYDSGTIKLTWIDPKDYKTLHSEMFNSVDEALNNLPEDSLGNNWLIFELVKRDEDNYEWKVLPYGKHKGYISGMKWRDNKILYYGSIVLAIYGGYSVIKLIANKLKK